MSVKLENTIKMFKEIHPDSIILIKVGTFFQSFGKDSYILSYLLGYQLKPVAQSYSVCGFPETGLARVLSKLEDMKINYIVLADIRTVLRKYRNHNAFRQEILVRVYQRKR